MFFGRGSTAADDPDSGLRWGEAAGLKVGRLDLLRRRVTVAETLSEVGGHLV
jgi:hypothetical protein